MQLFICSPKFTQKMETIIYTIVISLLSLLLIKLFFNFKKSNGLPPGPPARPIIGHLHLFKKPLHHALARISKSYGPIVFLRFGSRSVLVISSRSLAEQCFTTLDLAFANRVHLPSSKEVSFNYTAIGAANYGPYWRHARKIVIVELLNSHRIAASAYIRAEEIKGMVRKICHSWKSECQGRNCYMKMELKSTLFELSLNMLVRMIAGKKYFGQDVENSEEAKEFKEVVEEHFSLSGANNLPDFMPFMRFFDFQGVTRRRRALSIKNDKITQRMIDYERYGGAEKTDSMVAHLLSLQETNPEGYNDQTIKSIIMSLLQTGSDSSVCTIEWAMSNLLNNPRVLGKLTNEIINGVGNSRLLQESDLDNLPYLQCVIMETLRLYPTAPLLVPHESREDVSIEGYKIPRGTMLLVNVYLIHRDPELFEASEEFKPDRFEEETNEKMKQLMFPFGMGRRKCPGEGFAMSTVAVILGTLIQCFEWKRIEGEDEVIDMSEGSGLTLRKAIPLQVLYKPRVAMLKILSN
ncbi:hypothetical protein LUZ60_001549 [Juncus effusus]|nr:hypothetical protein LUZ60_001549 [Juncus effusus]